MSASKTMKTIALAATSQESHHAMKIKSLLKWLKSGHEIRVQITGKADRRKAMEKLFHQIEKEVKSGANVIQKVVKPESIKFYLKPTEDAVNFVIAEPSNKQADGDGLDTIMTNKDLLSEDFEKELIKSIEEERHKTKRK